ncbi:hypothetical protein [Synechococcus sp. RedBA-s]|uniref:hypothetical protein n=1 Tax=Synechococcus sp. RedBA-s TaxID=2823741 RepID=UPI0020CCA404|nr:hypothetical protein [Synechococcus sp. RedBA-s]MCP9800160.1 hypothetical protein [Synechococcus sp. RedBA-s]
MIEATPMRSAQLSIALPFMRHTFQVALALSVLGLPLAAVALPFKPDPTSFAIYLGKKAMEDGSRVSFTNLVGCAASGKGMKESFSCQTADALLTTSAGVQRSCKAVVRDGRPGVIWTAKSNGVGLWQGNLACPPLPVPTSAAGEGEPLTPR